MTSSVTSALLSISGHRWDHPSATCHRQLPHSIPLPGGHRNSSGRRSARREDPPVVTPVSWERERRSPRIKKVRVRVQVLFPEPQHWRHRTQNVFSPGLPTPFWSPHSVDNGQFRSVPLGTRLEFMASPNSCFLDSDSIYGLEHSVSYRKNFEKCRRKKGSWRILNILQNIVLMSKWECKWIQIKSIAFPLKYSGA